MKPLGMKQKIKRVAHCGSFGYSMRGLLCLDAVLNTLKLHNTHKMFIRVPDLL